MLLLRRQVFGLHPNADITYQTNLANQTLSTIINIQPKDGGGGAGETRESSVQRMTNDMLQKLPPDYVPHEVLLLILVLVLLLIFVLILVLILVLRVVFLTSFPL